MKIKTKTGRIVTMRDAATALCGESRSDRFAVNYALNQYGKATAKRIVALIPDGHDDPDHAPRGKRKKEDDGEA